MSRGKVSLKSTKDSWAPPRPGRMAQRNPDDILDFWETRCWWRDRDERMGLIGPDGMGRVFWEKIHSCERLKQWCATYPAQRLHPIFFILESMFHQTFGDKPAPRGEAKRRRREFEAATRKLTRIARTIAGVPAWAITGAERKRVEKILATASARRPWPTVVRILRFDEDRPKLLVDIPFDGAPNESSGHRPGAGFHFHSDLYLLSQHVRTLVGSREYWPAVVDLLTRFRPDQSGTVKAIRDRVNLFARTHRPRLAQLKSRLYDELDRHLTDPTCLY